MRLAQEHVRYARNQVYKPYMRHANIVEFDRQDTKCGFKDKKGY